MSSRTEAGQDKCRLLELPLELRQRIYRMLISPKYAKTQKGRPKRFDSSTRYKWNVDPVILRLNRQILEEARNVMIVDNKFVVVEWPSELQPEKVLLGNALKISRNVNVPSERMRVSFVRDKSLQSGFAAGSDTIVFLVEEFRDFCIGLSLELSQSEAYRTAELCVHIKLSKPPYEETTRAEDDLRRLLFNALTKLRYLKTVRVEGMSSSESEELLSGMRQKRFDEELVISTIRELLSSGVDAHNNGYYNIANAYYLLADVYLTHFVTYHSYVFAHTPGKPAALEFDIGQHQALLWIEEGRFGGVVELTNVALKRAKMFFADGAPMGTGPRTNEQGVVTKGAHREWICQCIKEGAERTGQLIRAEDIGRCYYYRSIAEHMVRGEKATEQADDDKMTGIGCCVVSDTVGEEDVPKELLELDIRTMEKLSLHEKDDTNRSEEEANSEDEWEDLGFWED